MKKITVLLLSLSILFSLCCPVVFAEQNTALPDYGIECTEDCKAFALTIRKVILSQFGTELPLTSECNNSIILSLSGKSADYSVKFDESSKDVYITGGSKTALEYAVNEFLSALLVTSGENFNISSAVDYSFNSDENSTDNSKLLKYKSSEETKLLPSYSDGILLTPDWADSLIIVELRPEMASIGGTLPECRSLVDFYAKAGVNAFWLPPIYDRGDNGNGYSNYGINTLEPAITGTDDYDEGWKIVKEFVDYAHSKGIYVFFDIITWGTVFDSPLINEHSDWFDGEDWGNAAFNWDNEELRAWFVDTAVENILKTGADGYRCDCEPNYTGYEIFGEIRERLYNCGKNIIVLCEDANTRKGVYDFEQDGVLDYSYTDRAGLYSNPVNFFGDGIVNIVDAVKDGKATGYNGWQESLLKCGASKYYINCITNHDYKKRDVMGSEINIGYAAILSPYIPLWYMGDEFNASAPDGVQYFNFIDYGEVNDADNALFFENVKKMIEIRRTYSDIFEYWPTNHRNSNICKVETSGFGTLQNYARYSDNKAVLVVACNDENSSGGTVKVPFDACNISGYKNYRITDLKTGKALVKGKEKDVSEFSTYVGFDKVGIYLVEGLGSCSSSNIDFDIISDNILTCFLNLFVKLVNFKLFDIFC